MGRPGDAAVLAEASRLLGWPGASLGERVLLRERPGRWVERVRLQAPGGDRAATIILKGRWDRVDDREAILYRGLRPAVLRLLGAPRLLGAGRLGPVHLLWLQQLPGGSADMGNPEHVQRLFRHLGRVHAMSAAWLIRHPPRRLADQGAWAVLRPGGPAVPGEPEVLDPGDLHPDNALLTRDRVRLVDFENLAVRPRLAAVAAALRDAGLQGQGCLEALALQAYCQGAGWGDGLAGLALRLPGS